VQLTQRRQLEPGLRRELLLLAGELGPERHRALRERVRLIDKLDLAALANDHRRWCGRRGCCGCGPTALRIVLLVLVFV